MNISLCWSPSTARSILLLSWSVTDVDCSPNHALETLFFPPPFSWTINNTAYWTHCTSVPSSLRFNSTKLNMAFTFFHYSWIKFNISWDHLKAWLITPLSLSLWICTIRFALVVYIRAVQYDNILYTAQNKSLLFHIILKSLLCGVTK